MTTTLVDPLGRAVELALPARRIVSLVPSLTELLFALGVGDAVVGVSDYCIHPADELSSRRRVGGQKDPSLAALRALHPDLVLCAKEENLRRDVEALAADGIAVWVVDVRTIASGLALPDELAALTGADPVRVRNVAGAMHDGVAAAARVAALRPRRRIFCPVWRDPWIGASADTYLQSVLALCGADDVCRDDPRRYPKVDLDAVLARSPELIVLPSEPYPFGEADVAELSLRVRTVLVDGTLACWYGPRMARLAELARLLD